MANVFVVYHSGYGHTKLQAEAVARGCARVPNTRTTLLTSDEAITRLDELDAANAIVFGCPTYMGNISADFKKFMEVAAKKWFTQAWKDKVAGAFTNSSNYSGDKLNTLMGLMLNAMQHGMIYVSLGIAPAANEQASMTTLTGPGPEAHNRVSSSVGAMATSFGVKPPEAPGKGDIETAEAYGARIATITHQLIKGRA